LNNEKGKISPEKAQMFIKNWLAELVKDKVTVQDKFAAIREKIKEDND
jgi:hypothetical protein